MDWNDADTLEIGLLSLEIELRVFLDELSKSSWTCLAKGLKGLIQFMRKICEINLN